MGAIVLVLLVGLGAYASYRWLVPRVQEVAYVGQVRTLHATSIADIETLRTDPAVKQLKALKVSEGNLTSTAMAMVELARSCRDARQTAEAVQARLGQVRVPPSLQELQTALVGYYAALIPPLTEIDAQTDYAAPLFEAWQSVQVVVNDARGVAGGADPDKSAASLEQMRKQLREAHEALAAKPVPPGCGDLRGVMIASLETASDLLGEVVAAVRRRDVRRVASLSAQAEVKRAAAYRQMQDGVAAWGKGLGDRFGAMFSSLADKQRQLNALEEPVNARLGLKEADRLPLFRLGK